MTFNFFCIIHIDECIVFYVRDKVHMKFMAHVICALVNLIIDNDTILGQI